MSKTISRRSFLKKALGTMLTTVGLSAGGYYYAGKIEPKLLNINKIPIQHKDIPEGFDNFKIIQFSDSHLGFQYDTQQLKKLVEQINSLKPDLLFFTGDLLDEPNKYVGIEKVIPILQSLQAPYGKYAVYGNHDHG